MRDIGEMLPSSVCKEHMAALFVFPMSQICHEMLEADCVGFCSSDTKYPSHAGCAIVNFEEILKPEIL